MANQRKVRDVFPIPTSSCILLIFIVFLLVSSCRKKQAPAKKQKKPAKAFLFVKTTQPLWKTTHENISVQGEIEADKISKVGTEIMGKVVDVRVREGDTVTQGQMLLRLDDSNLVLRLKSVKEKIKQAEASLKLTQKGARKEEIQQAKESIKAAQAAYDLAQKNETRIKNLFKDGAVSLAEVDAARSQSEQAKAQLKQTKEQLTLVIKGARQEEIQIQAAQLKQAKIEQKNLLDQIRKARIRAPFTAIVDKLFTQKGEVVSPGMPLFLLLGKPLYFKAKIAEKYRHDVGIGSPLILQKSGEELQTKISIVLPTVSPASRTFTIKAEVNSHLLPPGSFLTGKIITREARMLTLPEKSIKQEGTKTFVFLAEGGKARKKKVEGKWVEEGFAVTKGVTEKDEVITTLSTYLAEGTPVRVLR